jgi:hypothetical protein
MTQRAPDMGGQQPVHPAAEIPIVMRPESQVEVVGHQAGGQDAHRDWHGGLGDHVQEGVRVLGLVEDLGAGVTAVADMVGEAAPGGASGAWHGAPEND